MDIGVDTQGEVLGAPAYRPRALFGVWLYEFLSGVRSPRKLEGACRNRVPYLWLTGWQQPDHNTLWRFYQARPTGQSNQLRRHHHERSAGVHTGLKCPGYGFACSRRRAAHYRSRGTGQLLPLIAAAR